MTTQATAVSAVELKAQIEALKAQAKEAAKAERAEARAAAKAVKAAEKAAAKEVDKAARAAARAEARELRKAHVEALKMNAKFDKERAAANKEQALAILKQAYEDAVASLAQFGVTPDEVKNAFAKYVKEGA